MEKTVDPEAATLAAASSRDPELGLRAVAALGGLLEVLEALQVDNARANGWSWQDIASRLGVTKQAVHQNTAPAAAPGKGGSPPWSQSPGQWTSPGQPVMPPGWPGWRRGGSATTTSAPSTC